MKLSELKERIDDLINEDCYNSNDDPEVKITLSDVSCGARASCGVRDIHFGMDWETGQVRIEPDRQVISAKKDRDIPQEIVVYELNIGLRKNTVRTCPVCGYQVSKNVRYCENCGQRITETNQLKR